MQRKFTINSDGGVDKNLNNARNKYFRLSKSELACDKNYKNVVNLPQRTDEEVNFS